MPPGHCPGRVSSLWTLKLRNASASLRSGSFARRSCVPSVPSGFGFCLAFTFLHGLDSVAGRLLRTQKRGRGRPHWRCRPCSGELTPRSSSFSNRSSGNAAYRRDGFEGVMAQPRVWHRRCQPRFLLCLRWKANDRVKGRVFGTGHQPPPTGSHTHTVRVALPQGTASRRRPGWAGRTLGQTFPADDGRFRQVRAHLLFSRFNLKHLGTCHQKALKPHFGAAVHERAHTAGRGPTPPGDKTCPKEMTQEQLHDRKEQL